jgi:hypothetical protein
MATVYLHRSDSEFWNMTPRQLVALIDQWKEIEKGRDRMRAYIANGGDPDAVAEEVTATNQSMWSAI